MYAKRPSASLLPLHGCASRRAASQTCRSATPVAPGASLRDPAPQSTALIVVQPIRPFHRPAVFPPWRARRSQPPRKVFINEGKPAQAIVLLLTVVMRVRRR